MSVDSVLFGDPFTHIFNNLCVKDLYELYLTTPKYKSLFTPQTINQVLINKINDRLKYIFQDQYDNFKLALKTDKAVISGSFIIQCILGETWSNSDIDIYVPEKNSKLQDFFILLYEKS
jgi:hypothetical protein